MTCHLRRIIYGIRKWKLKIYSVSRKVIVRGNFGEFGYVKNCVTISKSLLFSQSVLESNKIKPLKIYFHFLWKTNTTYTHFSHGEPDSVIENKIIYKYISVIKNTITRVPKGFQKGITHCIIIFIILHLYCVYVF